MPGAYCIPGEDCDYCVSQGNCDLEREYIRGHLDDPMYILKSNE